MQNQSHQQHQQQQQQPPQQQQQQHHQQQQRMVETPAQTSVLHLAELHVFHAVLHVSLGLSAKLGMCLLAFLNTSLFAVCPVCLFSFCAIGGGYRTPGLTRFIMSFPSCMSCGSSTLLVLTASCAGSEASAFGKAREAAAAAKQHKEDKEREKASSEPVEVPIQQDKLHYRSFTHTHWMSFLSLVTLCLHVLCVCERAMLLVILPSCRAPPFFAALHWDAC